MAFYSLEPWGTMPVDLRTGIIASTIANVHRGKGKPAVKPDQFMPRWGQTQNPAQALMQRLHDTLPRAN